MQRRQPVLVGERGGEVAGQARRLELRAQFRGDVGRHRNAAVAAMRHQGERRRVLAGELHEVGSHGVALQACARQVGGGVLDADDVVAIVEELLHRLHAHVDDGARRDVVDDERDGDRVGHRLEMRIEAALARLVVIGRDHQHRVGAGRLRMLRQLDSLARVVGARPGDDRNAAGRRLDAELHDAGMLLVRQRRRFARRADRHESRRALANLPVHERGESGLVDRVAAHGRDQRGDGTPEHRNLGSGECRIFQTTGCFF